MAPPCCKSYPDLPILHLVRVDRFKQAAMYEKAIVMYAKQVDYFWYELSTFVHKLRLDVQTFILQLLFGWSTLDQAIHLSKFRHFMKRYHLYRNLNVFQSTWDPFLSLKGNAPKKMHVLLCIPTFWGNKERGHPLEQYECSKSKVFYFDRTNDSFFDPGEKIAREFFTKHLCCSHLAIVTLLMYFSITYLAILKCIKKETYKRLGETFCCILVPVNGILNNEEREPEIPNMLDNSERHEHYKTSFLIRPILQEIEES